MCFEVKRKDGSKNLQGSVESYFARRVVQNRFGETLLQDWISAGSGSKLWNSPAHTFLIIHYMMQTPLRCVECIHQKWHYFETWFPFSSKWFNDFLQSSMSRTMTGITAVFMNGAGCTPPFAYIKIVQGSRTACLWPCVTTVIVGKRHGVRLCSCSTFQLSLLYSHFSFSSQTHHRKDLTTFSSVNCVSC